MENNGMGIIRSAIIGMALGSALTAGAMYVNENKYAAHKAMQKAKASKKIITRAGENIIREITD